MKRAFFLLSVLLFSAKGFSQTDFRFADSTAKWNVLMYYHAWLPYPDYYLTLVFKSEADTAFNGVSYQNISGHFVRRDTANRIYKYRTDTSEFFLYDFGAEKGDTIYNLQSDENLSTYTAIVDSVDSVYVGHWRKRMFLSPYPDTWIDGLGSLHSHFLHPETEMLTVDGPDWWLLCYFENSQLAYHYEPIDTCIYNSATAIPAIEKNQIHVSSNPATTHLAIQTETNLPAQTTFQLFDLTGRMVLQKPLTEKTSRVEFNGLSKGMYLYQVSSPQQKLGEGKVVVE
jgi:hypothetical protein